MNVDDAIRDFATTGHVLPRDSMRWALDHWEEAFPSFLERMNRYADGIGRSNAAQSTLFFILHLIGDKGEPRAFRTLCRLALDTEAIREILGDGVTESLCGIFIGAFDGNSTALKMLVETDEADEFVREAALQAMTYLTRVGRIGDEEMRSYLRHLYAEIPRDPSVVWVGWVDAVSLLGYEEYAGDAERVLTDWLADENIMDVDDFRQDLRLTLDDPARMAGFAARSEIGPLGDAVEKLSSWHGFSEQYAREQARLAENSARGTSLDLHTLENLPGFHLGEPASNPFRDIGRNDPCPCGSGKKFKKCCLGLTNEAGD